MAIFFIILLFTVNSLAGAKHLQATEENLDRVFNSYLQKYSKNYVNDTEHDMRKAIFFENWKMIEQHNLQNLSYTMTVNKFADRTAEELTAGGALPGPVGLQGYLPFPYDPDEVEILAKIVPKNFDMRRQGYISPVKDQGQCNSCWAFAAVGAVEGALARKRGMGPIDLSVQALVDCVPADSYSNPNCNGNNVINAFEYIETRGVPFQEDYPYEETNDICQIDKFTGEINKIEGYSQPTPVDPDALKVALYYEGPVTVAMHFSNKLKNYHSGIFYDPECNNGGYNSITHSMLAVGYGIEYSTGVNYWILKNSFGADWGVEGYVLISAKDDNCFVLTTPLYPVV